LAFSAAPQSSGGAATRPSAFAVPALLLHLGMCLLVVAICADPLRALWKAVQGPVVQASTVPTPAWIAPPLFALVWAGRRLWRFALGRAAPLSWTWALLAVVVAAGAGRALSPGQGAAAWTSVRDAPPTVQIVELLKRLREKTDAALLAGNEVPTDAELAGSLEEGGAPLILNYRYRGLARRPARLVRVPDAHGPVDRKHSGDLAGTLYLAVAPDRRHYWLTAVVLLEDNGVESSDLLPGPNGVLVITNAAP